MGDIYISKGNTTANNRATRQSGQLSIDTTKRTIRVHDGSTAGGHELLKADLSNTQANAGIPGTGSVGIPAGTTGQRSAGLPNRIRINRTTSNVEFTLDGTNWIAVGTNTNTITNEIEIETFTSASRPTTTDRRLIYNSTTRRYQISNGSGTWENILIDGNTFTAPRATLADTATRATTADTAGHANSATTAVSANTANSATTAGTAATATRATTADGGTGTGAFNMTRGSTSQRPSSPNGGAVRENSTTNKLEAYQGGSWKDFLFEGDVSTIRGERGEQGLRGPIGPRGDDGDDGNDGMPGAAGAPGQGVPTGGTANQILEKIDSSDYNTRWVNKPTQGSTSLSQLSDVSTTTPTDNQVLQYDSGTSEWAPANVTGLQGPPGTPGAPGAASTVPGPRGNPGRDGTNGAAGDDGDDGIDAGITRTFRGTNVQQNGAVSLNHASITAVTAIVVSHHNPAGVLERGYVDEFFTGTSQVKSIMRIIDNSGAQQRTAKFEVTNGTTGSGFSTFTVRNGEGDTITSGNSVVVIFDKVGDKGDRGLQGIQGATGATGPRGADGTGTGGGTPANLPTSGTLSMRAHNLGVFENGDVTMQDAGNLAISNTSSDSTVIEKVAISHFDRNGQDISNIAQYLANYFISFDDAGTNDDIHLGNRVVNNTALPRYSLYDVVGSPTAQNRKTYFANNSNLDIVYARNELNFSSNNSGATATSGSFNMRYHQVGGAGSFGTGDFQFETSTGGQPSRPTSTSFMTFSHFDRTGTDISATVNGLINRKLSFSGITVIFESVSSTSIPNATRYAVRSTTGSSFPVDNSNVTIGWETDGAASYTFRLGTVDPSTTAGATRILRRSNSNVYAFQFNNDDSSGRDADILRRLTTGDRFTFDGQLFTVQSIRPGAGAFTLDILDVPYLGPAVGTDVTVSATIPRSRPALNATSGTLNLRLEYTSSGVRGEDGELEPSLLNRSRISTIGDTMLIKISRYDRLGNGLVNILSRMADATITFGSASFTFAGIDGRTSQSSDSGARTFIVSSATGTLPADESNITVSYTGAVADVPTGSTFFRYNRRATGSIPASGEIARVSTGGGITTTALNISYINRLGTDVSRGLNAVYVAGGSVIIGSRVFTIRSATPMTTQGNNHLHLVVNPAANAWPSSNAINLN